MAPKKSERLLAKRAQILAAAVEVFCEEGYDVASMDRVAERAGASKRTVYNHFGSKEALFEEVLGQFAEAQIASKQISWDPERTLEDQLRDFVMAKANASSDEASVSLMRVALGASIMNPGITEGLSQRFASAEDTLEIWLAQAHKEGALHVPSPKITASLFWAMASGVFVWPAVTGIGTPDLAGAEPIIQEMIQLFLSRHKVQPE